MRTPGAWWVRSNGKCDTRYLVKIKWEYSKIEPIGHSEDEAGTQVPLFDEYSQQRLHGREFMRKMLKLKRAELPEDVWQKDDWQ